jgi:hypothetical protein
MEYCPNTSQQDGQYRGLSCLRLWQFQYNLLPAAEEVLFFVPAGGEPGVTRQLVVTENCKIWN